MTKPIFLLTDFGLSDPYVGTLRAVIAGIAPASPVHDLGHELPPQDLRAGAYALMCSGPYLPAGSVVCAVVDPGVGSARRAVAVELTLAGRRLALVAPDNGLITPLLGAGEAGSAVVLDDGAYHLSPVSATFHGRDIFAPVAAHLAAGLALTRAGSAIPTDALRRLPWPEATVDGIDIHGEVLVVDRFGNLITNVRHTQLGGDREPQADRSRRWQVLLAGAPPLALRSTYTDVSQGDAVAYLGSTGLVEVAVRNGNAAARFSVAAGAHVRVAPVLQGQG